MLISKVYHRQYGNYHIVYYHLTLNHGGNQEYKIGIFQETKDIFSHILSNNVVVKMLIWT